MKPAWLKNKMKEKPKVKDQITTIGAPMQGYYYGGTPVAANNMAPQAGYAGGYSAKKYGTGYYTGKGADGKTQRMNPTDVIGVGGRPALIHENEYRMNDGSIIPSPAVDAMGGPKGVDMALKQSKLRKMQDKGMPGYAYNDGSSNIEEDMTHPGVAQRQSVENNPINNPLNQPLSVSGPASNAVGATGFGTTDTTNNTISMTGPRSNTQSTGAAPSTIGRDSEGRPIGWNPNDGNIGTVTTREEQDALIDTAGTSRGSGTEPPASTIGSDRADPTAGWVTHTDNVGETPDTIVKTPQQIEDEAKRKAYERSIGIDKGGEVIEGAATPETAPPPDDTVIDKRTDASTEDDRIAKDMLKLKTDIANGTSDVFNKMVESAFTQLDPRLQVQMTLTAMRIAQDPNMSEGAKRTAMAEQLRANGVAQSQLAADMASKSMDLATQATTEAFNMAQGRKQYADSQKWSEYDRLMQANDFEGAAEEFSALTGRDMDATRLEKAWDQGYDITERGMARLEKMDDVGIDQWNRNFQLELDKFEEGSAQWWEAFDEGKRQWTASFDEGRRQFDFGKQENAMSAALNAGDVDGYATMFKDTYGYDIDKSSLTNKKNRTKFIEGMDDVSALLIADPQAGVDSAGMGNALQSIWESEGNEGDFDKDWAEEFMGQQKLGRDPLYQAMGGITRAGAEEYFGSDFLNEEYGGDWDALKRDLGKVNLTKGLTMMPDGTFELDMENPVVSALFGDDYAPKFNDLPEFKDKTGIVTYQGSKYKNTGTKENPEWTDYTPPEITDTTDSGSISTDEYGTWKTAAEGTQDGLSGHIDQLIDFANRGSATAKSDLNNIMSNIDDPWGSDANKYYDYLPKDSTEYSNLVTSRAEDIIKSNDWTRLTKKADTDVVEAVGKTLDATSSSGKWSTDGPDGNNQWVFTGSIPEVGTIIKYGGKALQVVGSGTEYDTGFGGDEYSYITVKAGDGKIYYILPDGSDPGDYVSNPGTLHTKLGEKKRAPSAN